MPTYSQMSPDQKKSLADAWQHTLDTIEGLELAVRQQMRDGGAVEYQRLRPLQLYLAYLGEQHRLWWDHMQLGQLPFEPPTQEEVDELLQLAQQANAVLGQQIEIEATMTLVQSALAAFARALQS
jgi:hypothetical protein